MNEDKLYQALNLWVELTGIDPDGKSFAMGFSKSHSSWENLSNWTLQGSQPIMHFSITNQ
ncbi:hypothetical protein [Citrobacter sp. Cpo150]|uniref:hypothetical protein n=1 Tax=Citrobacter TaxID=544 RepID=UPI0025754F0F|nr:hypothetical protein [Citrobacter sp. Cpo150]MDM2765730.1 hypothetical protein [Citrobacter sp. Cpo150]